MRQVLLIVLGVVALSACAAKSPSVPVDPQGCALTPEVGEPDGGYGGTGNAPEDCPPAQ